MTINIESMNIKIISHCNPLGLSYGKKNVRISLNTCASLAL